MHVNNPNDMPFGDVRYLGIVIKETRPGWFHIGVLYKSDDNVPYICHLAWHYILRAAEVPSDDYDWLQSDLDELDQKVARAAFAGIGETKQVPIPYSTIYRGTYFEPQTLRYMRTEPGAGLTCATFIIEVFAALGIRLLKLDTWRERPSDEAWRLEMLAWLGHAPNVQPGHIEAQKAYVRDPRFRPEEVAAAVASSDCPLDFDTAIARGDEITGTMRRVA
jgi:hypothetical protein